VIDEVAHPVELDLELGFGSEVPHGGSPWIAAESHRNLTGVGTPSPLQLDAAEIVDAAVEILRDQGLDAVSMRTVGARLGVSPFPLYSRIGNKDALLDAMAERLLADLAPAGDAGEPWPDYARRWALELRRRLRAVPDSRLVLGPRRWAYVDAGAPLIDAMRRDGMAADDAVRGCRLLMWSTIGFVVTESGSDVPTTDADALFAQQLDYLLAGLTS
jgi:AcrR family transcriptional regulator